MSRITGTLHEDRYTRRVRKVKIHHVQADREIFYAYYGNTAVDFDPLPVSRARLTVVELAYFFLRMSYCSEMYKCLHEFSMKTVPDTSLHQTSDLIQAIEVYCVEDNIYA